MTFGERIVFYRGKKKINQKQLAQILGITPTRLNYWEKDKRQPDVSMIKAISDALEVSPDILIGNAPDESEQIKKSPELECSEERISMDESNDLFDILIDGGFIDEGVNLTDDDRAFLGHIIGLLDVLCRSKRK